MNHTFTYIHKYLPRPSPALYLVLPESLPFIIYRFPSFLPSTYESHEETITRWLSLSTRRAEAMATVLKKEKPKEGEILFQKVLQASVTAETLTEAQQMAETVLMGQPLPLHVLDRAWLSPLCHSLSQTASLPAFMLRSKITRRFRYILYICMHDKQFFNLIFFTVTLYMPMSYSDDMAWMHSIYSS